MDFKKSENENGLSVEIIRGYDLVDVDVDTNTNPKKPHHFLGGDDSNPSWEAYVNDYKEEYRNHVRLLRKCIDENGLIGSTGQDADDWYFKFSDGEIWGFTWRAWGDLMQAIVDKREGYMAYYM